jgi:tetratricopeptide (TPR) repeat protein
MIRDIQIGDEIGPIAYETDLNFEVIGIIKGGMGTVYIVLLKKYGTINAVKTFKDEYINFEDAIDQFKKEALAWINLEIHPNIVNAMLFDVINDRPFIFIELIAPDDNNRNTLEHYLNSDLSNLQILDWGIQFCYGINHAFCRGVSPHRDIKPANIMITQDKLLKITDFGLAKIWDNQKLITKKDHSSKHELTLFEDDNGGVMSGTYGWMAPETFSGQADVRSDIYSFGVVLYQMVNKGKLPFDAETQEEWKKAHQNDEIPNVDSIISPIIKKCLAKDPDDRYNDFDELRKDLEELYKEKTDKNLYRPLNDVKRTKGIHLNKGYGYEKLGMVDDALRTYEEARIMDSESFFDMINLGAAFNRLQQPKKAMKEYQKAVKKEPKSFLAHYNLGNALWYNRQAEDAISEYEESIRLNPKCKECHTNYGNLLRSLGNLDESIEHYNIVLDLSPDFFMAKVNLGIALGQKGNFDEAINAFQDAEAINPKSINLYNQWGILLSTMGDFEGAMFRYIKVLSLDPKNSDAHLLMGILFSNRGNLESAIHEFGEVIVVDPENYIAYQNLARTLQQSGKTTEALKYYDESLRINPSYEVSWLQKGLTLAELGYSNNAFDCLDKALEIKPNYTTAWLNKGNLFGSLGEYEKGIMCFDEVLKNDPKCDKAWYHKGMALVDLKNKNLFNEALQCFDEAIKINPTFHQAYMLKAKAWLLLNNFDESLKCIDMALKISPNNIEYLIDKKKILKLKKIKDMPKNVVSKLKKIVNYLKLNQS